MTATWALVYMVCMYRTCEVQYTIPYESRSECYRNIPKQQRLSLSEKVVCAPLSKD